MQTVRITVGALQTNCYIVYNEFTKKGFIIDPGAESRRICAELRRLNIVPEAVILTHGHFDHIMGIDGIKDEFEGIPVVASAYEVELLNDPALNSSDRIKKPYSIEPDITVLDREEFVYADIKITPIITPGHTGGSMCLYMKEYSTLFSGDTIFKGGFGRTDLPTGDMDMLCDSLDRIFSFLPHDTIVYPGHGDKTSIGSEYSR